MQNSIDVNMTRRDLELIVIGLATLKASGIETAEVNALHKRMHAICTNNPKLNPGKTPDNPKR